MKHKDDVLYHLNAPRFTGACMYIEQWLNPRHTDYATYSNTYSGVLTPSQISRVIESIILRLPMPKIWCCSTTETIFINGYILEAVKVFKNSEITIKNVTGLLENIEGKTYLQLDGFIRRSIFELELEANVIPKCDSRYIKELEHYKQLIYACCGDPYFVVK